MRRETGPSPFEARPRGRAPQGDGCWFVARLHPDLAKVDTGAELRLDGLALAAVGDLDRVGARVLVELVEFEVAVVVGLDLGDALAVLHQPHARAFDAVDEAVRFRRH